MLERVGRTDSVAYVVIMESSRPSTSRSTSHASRARSCIVWTAQQSPRASLSTLLNIDSSLLSFDTITTRFYISSGPQTLLDKASSLTCRRRATPRLPYTSFKKRQRDLTSLSSAETWMLRLRLPRLSTSQIPGIGWRSKLSNRATKK
jgi:hypothetical protein